MNAKHYMGEDERDELTEPDPPECPECGAAFDQPCAADCRCAYCVTKLVRRLDIEPEGDAA